MYSKTSATAMTMSTSVRLTARALRVLEHDREDHVAGVAAAVDRFLQQLEKILAQQQLRRIALVREKVAVKIEDQPVRLALDRLHALVEIADNVELEAAAQLVRHLDDDVRGPFEHDRARGEIDVGETIGEQHVALGELLDR